MGKGEMRVMRGGVGGEGRGGFSVYTVWAGRWDDDGYLVNQRWESVGV